jgi:hypothetical protein
MRTWTQYALAFATLAVFAGAIGFRLALGPAWPGDAAGPGPDPSAPNTAVLLRLQAKTRMAREVVAGRLSLAEAAAEFKALDAYAPPGPGFIFPEGSAEMSADEYYCRNVIDWAAAEAPRERAAEVRRQLQAELNAQLRGGTLRLPDPTTDGGPKPLTALPVHE